jgi:hypothetical protein
MRRSLSITVTLRALVFPRLSFSVVISGFNTDIEYQGTVYHVQTEDKGAPLHVIMSLVYDGGTILASKRASYEEIVATGSFEKEVAERLSRQHKLMCAAVKAGRINELVAMTRSAAAERGKPKAEPIISSADAARLAETLGEPAAVVASHAGVQPNREAVKPASPLTTVAPENIIHVVPEAIFEDELVLDAVHIIEDGEIDEIEILPAEAVAVVSELSGRERPANQKLSLELLSEARFKGGDRRTVNVMICRGSERKVVSDAQVMIKVLGSSFRPLIFHAKTDANGLARVHLQLPHFQSGRAAVLVRAISDGEEVELRRAITPG